jgi:hypothetical protein
MISKSSVPLVKAAKSFNISSQLILGISVRVPTFTWIAILKLALVSFQLDGFFCRSIIAKIDQTEFDGFEYVNPLLMSAEDVV